MATTDNKVVNGKDLEVYSTAVKQSIRNVENKLPLVINISRNSDVITCDTSIADIQAAYNAGRNIIAHVEQGQLNLLVCMEGIVVFTSMFENRLEYSIGVVEGNTDSWTRSGIWLQTLLTFDDTPTANSSNPVKSGGIKSALDDKQDIISDLPTIRSGASAGATAYQKPNTGIPKSDLDSSVQTSLGKADTALQQHQDLSSYADGAEYDSTNHLIYLKHGSTRLANPIDATDFIKDSMVDTVEVTGGNLVITFNTDSGKEDIEIPISDIFDANNYYNKTESDARYTSIEDLSNYCPIIEDTRTSQVGSITGNAPFETLVNGQRILLHSKYSNGGNITLNLTLSDNTTTGAKNVYFSQNDTLTQSASWVIAAGSYLELIYESSRNRWITTYTDRNTTYTTMSDAHIRQGTATGQCVISPKTLRDNFYMESEVDTLLDEKQDAISDLQTIRDGAALGATALQSYTETDPTVPSWAKQSTKPSYDYSEINNTPSLATVATSGSYNDLSNKPTIPTVPTNVSAFTNDAGYLTTHQDISGKQDVLTPGDGIAIDNTDTIRTTGIPYGECDSTSTATAFTATVPGIYKLEDGVCCIVKNGVITSASGFTLNINGLGAKPSYNNMTTGNDVTPTAPTRDTTIFNINYTMLFVYSETIVSGGGWICYRGYDANTNTIGYQVRSNSMSLPASQKFYRYRLLFTSANGTHYVPANTSSSTSATASKAVNQTPIDPFGHIVYYGSTSAVEANARPSVANLWIIYTLMLGYSFNRTGDALVLNTYTPVYVKCAPQSDGSAIIDADTPYVQALPTTADGKIYIFLGVAYNTTSIELLNNHPVYYHDGTGIRLWTGIDCYNKTQIDTKLEDKQDVISIVDASVTIPSELESNTFYDFGTISTNIQIPNLATPDDSSIVNIYAFCMIIDDSLSQAPSITLPQGVDLDSELDVNPGDYVEFSVMNNKAEAKVWQAQ